MSRFQSSRMLMTIPSPKCQDISLRLHRHLDGTSMLESEPLAAHLDTDQKTP